MRKLNEAERLEHRATVYSILDNLPPLFRLPTPISVRDADWFRAAKLQDRLFIDAFPAFKIDTFSGKIFPAVGIAEMEEKAGTFRKYPHLYGPTSGNFGKDFSLITRAFGGEMFHALVNANTDAGKIAHLRAGGADVVVAPEGVPATDYAFEYAKAHPAYYLINQYTHEGSIIGHERSMRHIDAQMRMRVGDAGYIFAAVAGTRSTLFAAHRTIKSSYPPGKIKIVGVASMSKEEKVPGSRAPENLHELERLGGYPYEQKVNFTKDVLDFPLVTSVTRDRAYELNGERVRYNFIKEGPTGALLEAGVYDLIRNCAEKGELEKLENADKMIPFALFLMDTYLAYVGNAHYQSFFS